MKSTNREYMRETVIIKENTDTININHYHYYNLGDIPIKPNKSTFDWSKALNIIKWIINNPLWALTTFAFDNDFLSSLLKS